MSVNPTHPTKSTSESTNRHIASYNTVVKVLGAGGAGNNTLTRIHKLNLRDIETVAINTDGQDLIAAKADKKILIGKNLTSALGAGGDPEIGERSAKENEKELLSSIYGTDLLFLTGGMGGGTATGSLPVISKLARDQGVLTVAVVTMPFNEEGIIRWENAQIGLDKLKKNVDCVIVLQNDTLAEIYPDLPMIEAFRHGDEILVNALIGISNLILSRGLINLDFADVSMILKDGPRGVIGLGSSDSENRAEEAARRALSHPMMNESIHGAQSALIHVAGGTNITLKEARQVVRSIAKQMDTSARIIWGVTIHKNLKNKINVMLIVTGLQDAPQKRKEAEVFEEPVMQPAIASRSEPEDFSQAMDSKSIFDIKDSIMSSGAEVAIKPQTPKTVTKTTILFYKIFEEEAQGDLTRFDRSIQIVYKNPDNRRAILDARQACRLLHASAQMFGFDEIAQLLHAMEEILASVLSREKSMSDKLLESLTLAMDAVKDLIQNRNDGRGETGYIVDRIRELKNEQVDL